MSDGEVRTLAEHLADPEHKLYPPMGVRADVQDLAALPTEPPSHHPRPWRFEDSGNGKGWIVDGNGRMVVSMHVWDRDEASTLVVQLLRINGAVER